MGVQLIYTAIKRKILIILAISITLTLTCKKKADDAPPSGGGDTCAFTPATDVVGADTLYTDQWHIIDLNADHVWTGGNKGENIIASVVDDGLEINHPDLSANIKPCYSYNYLNQTDDPSGNDHAHGTCVAGVIAARDLNSIGVRGIAPRAKLIGYNYLQSSTAANEADAMTRNISIIDVSNNSWGPTDGTGEFDNSSSLWKSAINTGLTTGRGGKGTIYLWAAGNGALDTPGSYANIIDMSNYDGYANYFGVLAICAVGDAGQRAWYSEPGANLWVCGPSMGDNYVGITTTDVTSTGGYDSGSYYDSFNGTSAAAPMLTGVAALIIKANPNLTWRDVRIILARTAQKNDAADAEWTTNNGAFTYNINYKYGFGLADANAAVTLASTWTAFSTPIWDSEAFTSTTASVAIPDNDATGVTKTKAVASTITHIEQIRIAVTITHSKWNQLNIILTSPTGTVSELTRTHSCPTCASLSGNTFIFGSSRHLEEDPDGTWSLTVKDKTATTTGTFNSFTLYVYGH